MSIHIQDKENNKELTIHNTNIEKGKIQLIFTNSITDDDYKVVTISEKKLLNILDKEIKND